MRTRAYQAAAVLLLLGGSHALAANSTQSPPPRADAIGGDTPAGDPNGAVRALGGVDDGSASNKPVVSVPHLGGEGPNRTGGLPPGTTGR